VGRRSSLGAAALPAAAAAAATAAAATAAAAGMSHSTIQGIKKGLPKGFNGVALRCVRQAIKVVDFHKVAVSYRSKARELLEALPCQGKILSPLLPLPSTSVYAQKVCSLLS
jgi:hypothetical protein